MDTGVPEVGAGVCVWWMGAGVMSAGSRGHWGGKSLTTKVQAEPHRKGVKESRRGPRKIRYT